MGRAWRRTGASAAMRAHRANIESGQTLRHWIDVDVERLCEAPARSYCAACLAHNERAAGRRQCTKQADICALPYGPYLIAAQPAARQHAGMSQARPFQRSCPICGIGLIAAETQGDGEANSIYQCPRCGLVVDVSIPAKKPAIAAGESR